MQEGVLGERSEDEDEEEEEEVEELLSCRLIPHFLFLWKKTKIRINCGAEGAAEAELPDLWLGVLRLLLG